MRSRDKQIAKLLNKEADARSDELLKVYGYNYYELLCSPVSAICHIMRAMVEIEDDAGEV